MPMKPLLTATELAKLRGVSISYICRLCRLPADHPKYIRNVKLNPAIYMITDPDVIRQYGDQYTVFTSEAPTVQMQTAHVEALPALPENKPE